jgi:hypothetical protein
MAAPVLRVSLTGEITPTQKPLNNPPATQAQQTLEISTNLVDLNNLHLPPHRHRRLCR